MTQEEKQLLYKDLCARLPYGVKFTLTGDSIYTMKGIDLIVTDEGDWEYAVTAKCIEPIEIEYIKPYLRPMSSMTEEEQIEMSNAIDADFQIARDAVLANKTHSTSGYNKLDWLNAHHFDYRGLIPMGLALEAKEGMYKTEFLRIRLQEEERTRAKEETRDRVEWLAEMERDRRNGGGTD